MDLQALPGRPGMLASLSRPAAAMRLFSASKHAEARKQEIKEVRPGADVEALSGKPDEDGMNIYQMDFVETALWTKELLLKMKHHEQLLKGGIPFFCGRGWTSHGGPLLAGLREDTAPKDTDAILTFKTTSVYDYDFTKPSPDPRNKSVECSFRVSDLVAMRQWNAKQRHKLLLLCGDRYDPAADTVTLTCDRYDERIFNKIHLSDAVDRLIGEVQVGVALRRRTIKMLTGIRSYYRKRIRRTFSRTFLWTCATWRKRRRMLRWRSAGSRGHKCGRHRPFGQQMLAKGKRDCKKYRFNTP